jgi:hypothetical protein
MFVFIFMLCTDKKTQFSTDKVVNCFIMSSAYVSARLMSGGTLVTIRQTADGNVKYIGPLLNPALSFGQMLISLQFKWIAHYFFIPFGGTVLALIFYEFVFVKSQEYLNADEEEEEEEGSSLKDGIEASPPSKKKLIINKEIEEDEDTSA